MHCFQPCSLSTTSALATKYSPETCATQPNDRGVDIVLSPPEQPALIHTNGSRVAGTVTFDSQAISKYKDCSLHFIGENATTFTQYVNGVASVHNSQVKLFEFSQPLQAKFQQAAGPESAYGAHCSWPFSFEFPRHSLPVEERVFIPSHKDFENQPGHPLPATWGFKNSYGRQGAHYYLEVRGHNSSSIFHRRLRVALPIKFVPGYDVPPPQQFPPPSVAQGCLLYQSRSLDPALAVEHRSFKTKLGDTLHPGRVPSSAFGVQFLLPQQVYASGRVPITLAISHKPDQSTYLEIPPVVLRGLHVRINVYSHYRVLSYHGSKIYTQVDKDKMQLCTGVDYEIALENERSLHLSTIIPELEVHPDVVPTFRSYLVARSYWLKVTGTFRCADMSEEVEVEGALRIWPKVDKNSDGPDLGPAYGDHDAAENSKQREAYQAGQPEAGPTPPPYDYKE